LKHYATELGLALFVLASFYMLILDTDMSAPQKAGEMAPGPALWVQILNKVFVMIFLIELALRIFVDGRRYFDHHGIMNTFVTFADVFVAVLDMVDVQAMPHVSAFRCFRLGRFSRLVWLTKYFPELGYMLQGLASAIGTVLWGMVFVILLLLIWSLLAVQILHPINLDVAAAGIYADCDRCPHAFSSVWSSFLTFSQTLVFGDSWGAVALPIIEEKWWAIFIFMLAFASVGLAAMNLILAAIVDSGAQAREAAIQARSEKARMLAAEDAHRRLQYLLSVCKALDVDESGRLSREELLQGFDQNAEFRRAAMSMKLGREDIQVLFNVIDKDCSGDVDYAEFLQVMQQTQGEDVQQIMVFLKFAVMDLWSRKREEEKALEAKIEEVKQCAELRAAPFQESCSSDTTATQTNQVQSRGQKPLPPVKEARAQSRSDLPRKKDARAEEGVVERDGSPRMVEEGASGLARAGAPSRRPKPGPAKERGFQMQEPKERYNEEVHLRLVNDWRPLEVAAALPVSDAADSILQVRLQQELVCVLKRITSATERLASEVKANARALRHIDQVVGRQLGTADPRADPGSPWPPAKLETADALGASSATLQVGGVFDPPPSAHGPRPGRELRVGL